MSVAVIIPTVDRPASLRRALSAVHGQTHAPSTVVVCPPDAAKLPDDVRNDPRNTIVDGIRGLTAQRNLALSVLPDDIELVAFFDDDAVPREDYLEQAAAVFAQHPDVVGLSGRVERDGAEEGVELDEAEIIAALETSRSHLDDSVIDVRGLYGCNMVARRAAADTVGFDERLPLYGWLEDLDFSRRLEAHGRLVKASAAVCVHQGSNSGGRKQHRRLGYSQVSNIAHLRRKGVIGAKDLPHLLGRPVLATLKGSVVGDDVQARRERLKGMCLAATDIIRGRVVPERISDL